MGKRIDNREFVVTWMNCETVDDVARNLGMSKPAVKQRSAYLRKLGVNLPKKNARKSVTEKQLEIAQLNSLIKRHSK